MTEISPAAQAVYEAAWAAYWLKDAEHPADAELIAAAALRAIELELAYVNDYGDYLISADKLVAIADELEAQ